MKFYIKQKVFSWGDKFRIYDEYGNDFFYVEGEVFSFGKKLHLYDRAGYELAYIHQETFTLRPTYHISRNGADVAKVVKRLSFFTHECDVEGFGWKVKGDFMAHEYEISMEGRCMARVSKKWFTWGDTYELDISDLSDYAMVLSVALVIDAVISRSGSC